MVQELLETGASIAVLKRHLMKRDMRVLLDDILESIDKIRDYTEPITEEDFYSNTEKQVLFLA